MYLNIKSDYPFNNHLINLSIRFTYKSISPIIIHQSSSSSHPSVSLLFDPDTHTYNNVSCHPPSISLFINFPSHHPSSPRIHLSIPALSVLSLQLLILPLAYQTIHHIHQCIHLFTIFFFFFIYLSFVALTKFCKHYQAHIFNSPYNPSLTIPQDHLPVHPHFNQSILTSTKPLIHFFTHHSSTSRINSRIPTSL